MFSAKHVAELGGLYTPRRISAMLCKVGIFCDFLFALLYTKFLFIKDQL